MYFFVKILRLLQGKFTKINARWNGSTWFRQTINHFLFNSNYQSKVIMFT
jgi:hypothetical protein